MKRLCAFMLVLVISIGLALPAQARGAQEEYEEAKAALRNYLKGDTSVPIEEIVSWFAMIDYYEWAYSLKEYATVLKEIDEGRFRMIAGRITMLSRDEAFCGYLRENGFSSLVELSIYAEAREAEANGNYAKAIDLYYETQVHDSRRRRVELPSRIDEARYAEALAYYNANTYADAQRAMEIFAELAESYYADSDEMAIKAAEKREELRSITASASGTGEVRFIDVVADGDWSASVDVDWLTLTQSSGTGNMTITASLEGNYTDADRLATISFQCGNKNALLSICQEKTDAIAARFVDDKIIVEANGSWTAELTQSWLSLERMEGAGDTVIAVQMEENFGPGDRYAWVTFVCGTALTSVEIIQEKKDEITATLVDNMIDVQANDYWVAQTDVEWLDLDIVFGYENATITLTAEENTSKDTREATITLTCGETSVAVIYRQEKADFIDASVTEEGDSCIVSVMANGAWKVTEGYNWMDLDVKSGNGDAEIKVTLKENNTGKTRKGTLVFTCGNATKKLEIMQKYDRVFEITEVVTNPNGSLDVLWTDSEGKAPYTVAYKQLTSSSWDSDENSSMRVWAAKDGNRIPDCFFNVKGIVPGCSYWIIVKDSDGKEAVYEYRAPAVSKFNEYENSLLITPRVKGKGSYADVRYFSAKDINENLSFKKYGIAFTLRYSQLARERLYYGIFAIQDPKGQVMSIFDREIKFPTGAWFWIKGTLDYTEYFKWVKEAYGSVPTGTYTMSLYLGGKLADSVDFTVND